MQRNFLLMDKMDPDMCHKGPLFVEPKSILMLPGQLGRF